MEYVSYYRVSTQRQGNSGLGLDAQKRTVENFLNGKTPIKEFIDIESGTAKGNDRKGLREALEYCKENKVKTYLTLNTIVFEEEPRLNAIPKHNEPHQEEFDDEDDDANYLMAETVEEEEVLKLEQKEIELIKKSLERHKGKRKAAADELGISERTLYRKIKQFDL